MADGTVTPKDIWDALENAGATAVQAAGIMGNMIAESSLNPEAHAVDSNGYESYGLVQWNAASYPSAATLVTGNPAKDLKAQIDFLASTGGFKAATGSTPSAVAGNFADGYERCATCEPGETSYDQRVSNAGTVSGWARQDNWPSSSGDASDNAELTAAQTAGQATAAKECAWSIAWGGIPGTSWFSDLFGSGGNLGSGQICLVSRAQVRSLLGGAILLGGTAVAGAGLIILAGSALAGTKAGTVAQGAASFIPGVGAVSAGIRTVAAGA